MTNKMIPERLRSTEGLLTACIAAGGKLGTLPSEWIFSAKPCPTLHANFAYNSAHHKVELVIVQPPPEQAAKLGEMPLTIGWGEADGDGDVAMSRTTHQRLNPVDRNQLVELSISRRRRQRKRAHADADDADATARDGAAPHLLWVRIDPSMELPLSVQWTGRPEEPNWTGMPERMCADQLQMDRHVPSRVDAAHALATFQSDAAIQALATCVRDPAVYFRVRVAAAVALGSMVEKTGDLTALTRLIERIKSAHFEDGRALKPCSETSKPLFFCLLTVLGISAAGRKEIWWEDPALTCWEIVQRAMEAEVQDGIVDRPSLLWAADIENWENVSALEG